MSSTDPCFERDSLGMCHRRKVDHGRLAVERPSCYSPRTNVGAGHVETVPVFRYDDAALSIPEGAPKAVTVVSANDPYLG